MCVNTIPVSALATIRTTMRYIHIAIVLLFTISLTLSPAEAGILSWILNKLSFFLQGNKLGTSNSFNTGNQISGNQATIGSAVLVNSQNSGLGFTGHNSGIDTSFGNYEAEGSNILRSGPVYEVKCRQYLVKQQCTEEIFLLWHGDAVGKTFKPKCIRYGTFRDTISYEALLLIGNPTEDFCLFSSRKQEYYYKDNQKWIIGSIVDGKIKEDYMKGPEISKVISRINKWREVMDEYGINMQKIGEEQTKAGMKLTEESNKVSDLMSAAGDKYNRNLEAIERLREQDYQRQAEDYRIFNQMISKQGWSQEVRKFQNDMQARQRQADSNLRAKQTAEQQRFQQEMSSLRDKMRQVNDRYQQENHKLQLKYAEEGKRLYEEYNKWILKGY